MAVLAAACVRQLPAAPTPEPIAPPIATSAPAPAEGMGRLVVDVVDGPMPVYRVHMQPTAVAGDDGRVRYRFSEKPESFCLAAPCLLEVPSGNVLLAFPMIGKGQLETELVHVDPGTTVYRRSLSLYQDNTGALRTWGIVSTAVGGTATMTGAVLLPIGLGEDMDGMTTAGAITLGAGIAMLVFGIWAIRKDAPTYRPGSANHFSP
ncbi:MAG: hypothetical protein K8M05_12065 [Deltaproteobacteria bacterium]|nr:hypothetical protein [Kofleriaceae bacterium]